MKRYFFLADNLDKLAAIEHDLQENGLSRPQIHVLSHDDCGVTRRRLNDVEAVLRKDVVYAMQRGAIIGAAGATLALAAAHYSGLTTAVGWAPFVFLAIVVLGFFTWEGGLLGIQEPHRDFRRFEQALNSGRHLLVIDVNSHEQNLLNRVTAHYPELEFSGTGDGAPNWFIGLQNKWRNFVEVMP
ncbi:NAD/FAD-utilizing enzyme [Spongiibacter sp.]|uniref:NAD/FAD-utilizing enzyme n=1 Tax=Spongiibacter sp. TaxID=2024860 RepID=UPI000C3BDCFA|nr:NAD/FAD-utilizing enzyme [Spongiibacter sp.]MBU71832.1 NAD/FAD-utilizing enzyme [Spongiibacter sp.]|tara:strand:+ start:249 stop:803 length:555 start_codon:yes stop_codon:yes gene_type:complete